LLLADVIAWFRAGEGGLEVDPLGGVGEDRELVFLTLTPHDGSATIDYSFVPIMSQKEIKCIY
jgi:hypothetical protein